MLRDKSTRFVLLALLITGAAAACSSDSADDTPGEDRDAGSRPDGDASTDRDATPGGDATTPGDASLQDAQVPPGDAGDLPDAEDPDLPITPFPSATPRLFGYTLVDAFPGTFLSGAMDIEWPAGSNEPFVLQRGGHIVRLHGNGQRTLVLNFENTVAMRGEAGTLGMALHPKFADAAAPQPYVYIWYTREGNPTRQRLARFTWNPGTQRFDPGSEQVLLDQNETSTEHNGARIQFGPDGFLYFGNGDDTRTATTQTLSGGLFSGIFRIDVDRRGGAISHAPPRTPQGATTGGHYFIPNDNPFVGRPGAMEEYFALGFRNPYRFNFDRQTGALWLGDVGESWREEINRVVPGGNYGWPFYEGRKRANPGEPTLGTLQQPVYEYAHWQIADLTSTVAGYVYRGAALPELGGKLVFSDWPTGRVWALDTATGTRSSLIESNADYEPVNFGQDAAGEMYMIAWSKILKLVRDPAPVAFPRKLSETHLFRNPSTLRPASSLHGYSIRSPLWSDGASKQRWVHVPEGSTASMDAAGNVQLPPGSLLVKQFDLPDDAQPAGGRTHRRLETRVLVVGDDDTYGVTYRWNAQGTDADLITEAVHETVLDQQPGRNIDWHYPSFGECWSCHREENRVLGFRGNQLNFALPSGENQLEALADLGIFDAASVASAPAPLVSPSDESATIEERASAYMAANCWSCHHPGASFLGGTTWDARPGIAPNARGLLNRGNNNAPMARELGLPFGVLVRPGDPDASLLLARLRTTDRDLGMPPLGRSHVDPVGVEVLRQWITSLAP